MRSNHCAALTSNCQSRAGRLQLRPCACMLRMTAIEQGWRAVLPKPLRIAHALQSPALWCLDRDEAPSHVLSSLCRPRGAAVKTGLAGFFANCPENAFQRVPSGYRPFTPLQRSGAVVRNGAKLLGVGFGASLIGVSITNALIFLRQQMDPSWMPQNAPQVLNALIHACMQQPAEGTITA